MSDRIEKTSEVDIIELLLLLWSKRKRIVINCSIAAVLAVIAAFSIPKEYTSTVVMAPEMSPSSGVSGSLGDMASLVGINLGGLAGGFLGGRLYGRISTVWLRRLFALFLLYAGVKYLL